MQWENWKLFLQKIVWQKIDTKLKLKEHVEALFYKASQKINDLTRISLYMTFQQRKLILGYFVISYFSYCPIFCVFHNRRLCSLKCFIEIFKVKVGIVSDLMKDVFQVAEKPYNLWHKFLVKSNNVRTAHMTCIFRWLQNLGYNTDTQSVPKYKFTFSFQRKYKEMESENCPCRIFKNYFKVLGVSDIVDGI